MYVFVALHSSWFTVPAVAAATVQNVTALVMRELEFGVRALAVVVSAAQLFVALASLRASRCG